MICPRCQHENEVGAAFCEECGAELELRCPGCGQPANLGARFCKTCGLNLAELPSPAPETRFASPQAYTPRHLAEKILTSRSALEGERKLVTVLFCDLVHSTALAERLGPEVMHTLLNRFFELALTEVHRYEGAINQFLGDGFMALFGAPIAYEDHARRAVLAALGIQRSLKERRADLGHPHGVELSVRMGLNTGLVVVGRIGDNLRMDYTAVGDTTHLAARLEQLAEPGTVYLSENTHQAMGDYFECHPLGARTVKGKAEPVPVYKVLGLRAHPESLRGRGARGIGSPLVGREGEVTTFMGCLERLVAGRGGVVSITGEVGLGKSRLVAEVRRQVADRDLLWLEGRALSFGQTLSYWPFLEIFRGCVGITEEDSEGESWAKLARRVRALFPEQVAEILPYLAMLLVLDVKGELADRVKYLDGEAMGRQIFRTARRFFDRLPQERPTVLVFEDWHWTDHSSAELLEHLLPLVETVSLLLCVVSRPDSETPATRLRELAAQKYADRYTDIILAPLPPAESAHLVQNLLKHADLSPRMRELILGKAEGNPLFLEELIRTLIDLGALVRDEATGGWRATAQVEQLPIPDTLQGVITARVDRLEEEVKQVLKVASVIGRSFFYRVLRAIGEAERELDRHLTELQHLELIRAKRRSPELEYIFKHALVQEATYESILIDRRRQLHRRVGECLEALFAERLDEFYGLLAYHYARAEEWEKAQDYLFKAGDQAGKIAADAEALAHYRLAVAAYARVFGDRRDPVQWAVLDRKIGEALFRRGEHDQALEYLQRALTSLGSPYPTSRWGIRLAILRQLVEQVGHRVLPGLFLKGPVGQVDPAVEEQFRIYKAFGWIDYFRDQERLVLDVFMLLNVSERSGYPLGVVVGSMGIGIICDLIPLHRLAQHYHRRAVSLSEQIQHPMAMGHAYHGIGMHEHCLGKLEAAIEHYQWSAAAYREAGDLRGWGAATILKVWLLWLQGNSTRALEHSEELVRVGEDAADHQVWGWGLQGLGRTLWQAGALERAADYLQHAIELFKGVPDYPFVACASGDLGMCYLRQGKLQQALATVEDANHLIAERRLRGLLLTQAHESLAEAYVVAAEQAESAERIGALRKAKRTCLAALKQGKLNREGLARARRLQGTYKWLRGKPTAAQEWWQRSLVVAQELGARYELGKTYLEMGKRKQDRSHLARAEAIFTEIGAMLDLAQARELLKRGTAC